MDAGRVCPICWQPDGRHWTVPHVHMPRVERERIRRWFSEEAATEWLRQRLNEIEQ